SITSPGGIESKNTPRTVGNDAIHRIAFHTSSKNVHRWLNAFGRSNPLDRFRIRNLKVSELSGCYSQIVNRNAILEIATRSHRQGDWSHHFATLRFCFDSRWFVQGLRKPEPLAPTQEEFGGLVIDAIYVASLQSSGQKDSVNITNVGFEVPLASSDNVIAGNHSICYPSLRRRIKP